MNPIPVNRTDDRFDWKDGTMKQRILAVTTLVLALGLPCWAAAQQQQAPEQPEKVRLEYVTRADLVELFFPAFRQLDLERRRGILYPAHSRRWADVIRRERGGSICGRAGG